MDDRFYVGQYKQDRILEQLCYPKGTETHRGIFLEVGAWDGVDISNTYFLEKVKDWTGLLVEPLHDRAEQARHNRWCPVWDGCVWDRDGTANFQRIEGYSAMLSGIKDAFQPAHIQRVNNEIKQHDQTVQYLTVPCRTLNTLMSEQGLPHGVDLLSLDTQTSELAVLRAYDPKRHPAKAILLDTNGYNKDELTAWFRSHGYEQYWKHDRADEMLWVNPHINWSWERS